MKSCPASYNSNETRIQDSMDISDYAHKIHTITQKYLTLLKEHHNCPVTLTALEKQYKKAIKDVERNFEIKFE